MVAGHEEFKTKITSHEVGLKRRMPKRRFPSMRKLTSNVRQPLGSKCFVLAYLPRFFKLLSNTPTSLDSADLWPVHSMS